MPNRTMDGDLWAWLLEIFHRSVTQNNGSNSFAKTMLSEQHISLTDCPTDKRLQDEPSPIATRLYFFQHSGSTALSESVSVFLI